jgi:acetyl-CoA C-acetyltransferase
MSKSDIFIVDALRTPVVRYASSLKNSSPDELAALVIKEIVERNLETKSIDKEQNEDIIIGCSNRAGENKRNAALMAG